MPALQPGPYALPGSSIGGDIPPDPDGNFNDNGTFTGCVFDSMGNLFAADIGQAQGATASPDQGRIIEWFAPQYDSFCIVVGPTQGGDGPHHVNGTGGLHNPGIMAVDSSDNLYVPESGVSRIVKIDHASLPRSAADCDADGLLTPPASVSTFIHTSLPGGIARDPTCDCWAVSHLLLGPAVTFYDDAGEPTSAKAVIPGGNFNPFGLAVSPGGDVFFADIALRCDAGGCGPTDGQGGVFKVSYTNGEPQPPQRIAGGLSFPVSVTICDASKQVCPQPPS